MERLWTPWRMDYVSTAGREAPCIFCAALEAADAAQALVLRAGQGTFTILNAYPYNTGHLMVAPERHVADLGALSVEERHNVMDEVERAVSVLTKEFAPHGFNVGLNLGLAAGAGVPGHLHVHVVPRWGGDTNFMTTVGDAKVMPETLDRTYARLLPLFGSGAADA